MKRNKQRSVEDFMSTAVISLRETDTIDRVQLEMSLAEIRHMLVVDGRNHVVGIVSSRDLLWALAKDAGKPVQIAQIMTRHVRVVSRDTPAADAAALMIEHKIGSLPVVGEGQELVGIITETDFLEIAEQALKGIDVSRGRAEL